MAKTTEPFRLVGESGDGKRIHVEGPDELFIEVENDDVCENQLPHAERVVAVLNAHWDS